MCYIIEHQLHLFIPKCLTAALVRKFFPQCAACPRRNLARRPLVPRPIDRVVEVGAEWEVNIKGPWTDSREKNCPSHSNMLYSLLCRDRASKFRVIFLLRNRGFILRYLITLRAMCAQRNRPLRRLTFDKEFASAEITEWCLHEKIDISVAIPYEHATMPNVERDHRTLQEAVVKALSAKPHLTDKFWAMCAVDVVYKMNVIPTHDDPTVTPYFRWYGSHFDPLANPLLPFGSIVYAHIPIPLQTTLS